MVFELNAILERIMPTIDIDIEFDGSSVMSTSIHELTSSTTIIISMLTGVDTNDLDFDKLIVKLLVTQIIPFMDHENNQSIFPSNVVVSDQLLTFKPTNS